MLSQFLGRIAQTLMAIEGVEARGCIAFCALRPMANGTAC